MKLPKDNSFAERRKSSIAARMHLLEKFKAAPKPDDPGMLAKRAEREAIAAARDRRRGERERLKQERLQIEKAEADAREASLKELAERVVSDEAERKAKRDRKYAARKARQR